MGKQYDDNGPGEHPALLSAKDKPYPYVQAKALDKLGDAGADDDGQSSESSGDKHGAGKREARKRGDESHDDIEVSHEIALAEHHRSGCGCEKPTRRDV